MGGKPLLGLYRKRQNCALCRGSELEKALQLGNSALANEFVKEPGEPQDVYPLDVVLCRACGHLQMGVLVDSTRLFGSYVYVTGTSPVTVQHFDNQARTVMEKFSLGAKKVFVVEIGSNDGTALAAWQQLGATVLGVDPAGKIVNEAVARGVPTLEAFFDETIARSIVRTRGVADVVIANNVFAHAEDLLGIARGVKTLIGKTGVFVCEVSYLRDIVDHLAFDTIYHEHFSYHAVAPLARMFSGLGLKLFDAEWNKEQIGRGSLRIYVADAGNPLAVNTGRVEVLVQRETADGFFDHRTYVALKERIDALGASVRSYLEGCKRRGKTVAGYGAPAKLTTLMSAFWLGASHVAYVADDSPWKQGLYTPGFHLPVVSPAEMKRRRPDVCVIWAWNFAESIMVNHADYGGAFVIPLPELRELLPPRRFN